jgi:hypothetical protein
VVVESHSETIWWAMTCARSSCYVRYSIDHVVDGHDADSRADHRHHQGAPAEQRVDVELSPAGESTTPATRTSLMVAIPTQPRPR